LLLRVTTVLTSKEHITIFYNENNHSPENIRRKLEGRKVNTKNIDLIAFKLEKDNIWIRDYGPIFMRDMDQNTKIFSFAYPHEMQMDYTEFAEQYALRHRLPFARSNMFSAGGGREFNGKGTIILVEGHELHINPDLSIEEIENEYREKFNQTNVIWLKRGIPQDDLFDNGPVLDNIYGNGVNWHIDEFCRFADPKTILLAKVDSADLARDSFYKVIDERLEESYCTLKHSKDQDGNPFEIIRVPQAPVIFTEANLKGNEIFYTPVTSYLNYVLTNNFVVIPAYYRLGDPEYIKEKDKEAKKVFQSVFKDRKVVMINAIDLNYNGGGLHCITSHKPKSSRYRRTLAGTKRLLG
jgi:agmatine deiminase